MEKIAIMVVARSPHAEDIGHLSLLLCYFDKLEFSNFSREYCDELSDYLIDSFELNVGDRKLFKKEIFHISQGNPSVIKEICNYARNNKYKMHGEINLNLVDIDRRIAKIKT
jgi:hypothetical protein